MERTITPIVPMDTIVESSTRLASTEQTVLVSDGDPPRPFTLNNLEALGEFSSSDWA